MNCEEEGGVRDFCHSTTPLHGWASAMLKACHIPLLDEHVRAFGGRWI